MRDSTDWMHRLTFIALVVALFFLGHAHAEIRKLKRTCIIDETPVQILNGGD